MIVNLIGKGPIFEKLYLFGYKTVKYPCEKFADVLVCSGYSKTVLAEEISFYPRGIINIHTSLLPRYRGRHPIDWAMENQEKEIGITIHYIDDETIDTGDIILQDSIPYVVGEGYDSVMDKICKKVPLMLRVALEQIKMGCVYRRSQNEEVATYYPKRTKPRIY